MRAQQQEINTRFTVIEQQFETFKAQTVAAYNEAKTIADTATKGQQNLDSKMESIKSTLSDEILSVNESIQATITEITQKYIQTDRPTDIHTYIHACTNK